MASNMIKDFFKLESASGILLGISAIAALLFKNSIFHDQYELLLTTKVVVAIGEFNIDKPLLLWVNDGLMAIFFLLVGLEIKREILEGQLSKRDQIALPGIAAFGGILVPALFYVYFNYSTPESLGGWAIPAATDIAFALGILMILGSRVHENLKICLLAIAIMDDLAAIIIIALFYTKQLSVFSLLASVSGILGLAWLNYRGVKKLTPYMIIGTFVWVCVLKSGVHATLAGVVLALFIPLNTDDPKVKPLKVLEHELHPWVAFGILPIFAFCNAGVSFAGVNTTVLLQPITLGIATGLFFGKQIGVMGFTLLGCALKICKLPNHVTWRQYYGMACITGVGFTMSLFIGTLAFDQVEQQTAVRLGVLLGSFCAGVLGYCILRFSKAPKEVDNGAQTETA